MNTVIFQIGLLAFCVSVVILGVQQLPVLETVSRSFMVFVGIVVICAILYTMNVILFVKSRISKNVNSASPTQNTNAGKKVQSSGSATS